jgi:G3E family GTPase
VLEIPDGDDAGQIEWLGARLRELAESGRFERVLVEAGGMTNTARLARHFGAAPGEPETFAPWAELAQNICVVDALDFFRAGRGAPPEPALGHFQNEQMADASLIVLNKCDLLDASDLEWCRRNLHAAHHPGRIIETAYGEVPPDVWTPPASAATWSAIFDRRREAARAQAEPVALASALYRVHRPFHAERFWEWFDGDHPGLLRVKGLVWLATRHLYVGGISRTRWQNGCGAAGIWWDALPREEWPGETEALRRMQETWREPYGDRRQELILIGDPAQLSGPLRRRLDACLLTDAEFARGPAEWAKLTDPFPTWDVD